MDQLAAEGFVRIPSVIEPSGIYCLLQKGEVVYVGKSKSVFNRIAQHYQRRFVRKRQATLAMWKSESEALQIRFDDAWVLFCDLQDLERLELEYIDRFNPKWNIQIREPLPNLKIDIHVIAAQMKWDLRKDIPRRKGL